MYIAIERALAFLAGFQTHQRREIRFDPRHGLTAGAVVPVFPPFFNEKGSGVPFSSFISRRLIDALRASFEVQK